MKTKSLLIGVGLAIAIYLILPFNHLFNGIEGSGNVIKETRELNEFHGIDVGGAFHVMVTKGNIQKVEIESDDNIIPRTKTTVKNGILEISTEGNIKNAETLNIYITIPNLDNIDLSGASKLISTDKFTQENVEIEISGASELQYSIEAQKMDIDASGASKASISGFANVMEIEASGASAINANELSVNNASVDCSGASDLKILVLENLKGEASGASQVLYSGNPKQVTMETSGAASVSRK